MIESARGLFASQGYVATTIEDIAVAAGLAVPTVYKHFGSKRGLLMALIERTVDRRVPDLISGVMAEADPRRRVAALARMCVALASQAPDVISTAMSAATVDPAFAEMITQAEESRRNNAGRVARSIAEDGALAVGVDEREAQDVLWALAGPQLYDLLAIRSGWGDDRFGEWLVAALAELVLRPEFALQRVEPDRSAAVDAVPPGDDRHESG